MATIEYVTSSPAGSSHENVNMPLNVQSVIGQPIIDVNGLNGDSGDSRKRPLENMENDFEAALTKRQNILMGSQHNLFRQHPSLQQPDQQNNLFGDDNKYIVKLLIPSTVAGSIIGKGGQTIAQLQRDTGTNIKLSKANDFYPGTSERVALLTGTVESLNSVASFIVDKIRESPQLGVKAGVEHVTTPERARQVKLVVPNSTAGLIIGKGGAMIKTIMEQSGARVQISQKSEGVTLSERVITITGEHDADLKALSFIISKVQEDPQSGSCNNLSYASVTGPIANANPTGSPFADSIPGVASSMAAAAAAAASMGRSPLMTPIGVPMGGAVPTAGLPSGQMSLGHSQFRLPSSLPNVPSIPVSEASHLSSAAFTQHLGGYTFQNFGGLPFGATNPMLGATAPFSHMLPSGFSPYQITFPHAGSASQSPHASLFAAAAAAAAPRTSPTAPSPGIEHTVPPSSSPNTSIAATPVTIPMPSTLPSSHEALVPGYTFSPMTAATTVQSFPGIALQTESHSGLAKETVVEVEVPESLVGAILGKSGRTLVEFQNYSGAKIQISKKGEFVPGTRNRRVTIKGPLTSTQTAHFLVTQRVAQEEQNRALKGTT